MGTSCVLSIIAIIISIISLLISAFKGTSLSARIYEKLEYLYFNFHYYKFVKKEKIKINNDKDYNKIKDILDNEKENRPIFVLTNNDIECCKVKIKNKKSKIGSLHWYGHTLKQDKVIIIVPEFEFLEFDFSVLLKESMMFDAGFQEEIEMEFIGILFIDRKEKREQKVYEKVKKETHVLTKYGYYFLKNLTKEYNKLNDKRRTTTT